MVTILQNPFFVELVLPFLLIFVVMFAILQKTKVLGDDKKQIDALVSLVIGLIVVSFGYATGIIISLIPFLAVSVVIIFVFLVLYGMSFHGEDFKIPKLLTTGMGIVVAIAVIIAVLIATGAWDYIADNWIYGGDENGIVTNIIFIVIIIAAIATVMFSGGKGKSKDK